MYIHTGPAVSVIFSKTTATTKSIWFLLYMFSLCAKIVYNITGKLNK